MIEDLKTWVIALPVGAALGWFAKSLLGPTVAALGEGLHITLSQFWNKKNKAISAYQKIEDLVRDNHKVNGYNRFCENKTYLKDRAIQSELAKYGKHMLCIIKKEWIDNAGINSYDESDIFFAGMDLLFPQIKKSDITKIYLKFKDNNQAAPGLWLGQVKECKPKLLTPEVLKYVNAEQDKLQQYICPNTNPKSNN